MTKLLFRFGVFVLAVFIASVLVGGVSFNGIVALLVAGALLLVIHTLIKPVISIITLPINLITFGVFSLVLNAIFFWFVGNVIPGFFVATFVSAFWGGVVVSVANWLLQSNDDN